MSCSAFWPQSDSCSHGVCVAGACECDEYWTYKSDLVEAPGKHCLTHWPSVMGLWALYLAVNVVFLVACLRRALLYRQPATWRARWALPGFRAVAICLLWCVCSVIVGALRVFTEQRLGQHVIITIFVPFTDVATWAGQELLISSLFGAAARIASGGQASVVQQLQRLVPVFCGVIGALSFVVFGLFLVAHVTNDQFDVQDSLVVLYYSYSLVAILCVLVLVRLCCAALIGMLNKDLETLSPDQRAVRAESVANLNKLRKHYAQLMWPSIFFVLLVIIVPYCRQLQSYFFPIAYVVATGALFEVYATFKPPVAVTPSGPPAPAAGSAAGAAAIAPVSLGRTGTAAGAAPPAPAKRQTASSDSAHDSEQQRVASQLQQLPLPSSELPAAAAAALAGSPEAETIIEVKVATGGAGAVLAPLAGS